MFGLTPYRRGRRNLDMRRGSWDIDKMFDSMWDEFYGTMRVPDDFYMGEGNIKVDVRENESEYVVEAELPGVEKDNITLELRDDLLTISVEKNEEIEEEKDNYIRRERHFGTMSRSFYVDDIDGEKVNAKFENGILYVMLPKKQLNSSGNNQIPIE